MPDGLDDLYRERILDHYKHPRNHGVLAGADLEAEELSPFCGDELHVTARLDEAGQLADVAFEGHGCAISQAAASMASEDVIGMTPAQLLSLPGGYAADLVGTPLSATRDKCASLSLRALQAAALAHLAAG